MTKSHIICQIMCFLGPRKSQVPREAKGDKLVPGARAPELAHPGRAQGKNSAPAAARLCGLDRAHQPRVAGPGCEAGGGRTEAGEAAPRPAPSHRCSEHLAHREKTRNLLSSGSQGQGGRRPLRPPARAGGADPALGRETEARGSGSCRDAKRSWGLGKGREG